MALWDSVVRELRIFRGILFLLFRRLDLPWCENVGVTGACRSGHASRRSRCRAEEVAAVGRWQERWRYRYEGCARNPRARAQSAVESPEELLASEGGMTHLSLI